MDGLLVKIVALATRGEIKISAHGYDELADDGILARDVVEGLPRADVVEEYPDFRKGPCVLVLQRDSDGNAIHALWGIPRGANSPAVLITAYRPDPARWSADFLRRIR